MDVELFNKILVIEDPLELARYGYQLQEFVNEAPWCAIAHKLLFKAMCGIGGDAYMSHLEKTSLYVYSRSELFSLLNNFKNSGVNASSFEAPSAEVVEKVESANETLSSPVTKEPQKKSEKVYVVGGDYFNKEDYLSVQTPETNTLSERLRLHDVDMEDAEAESVTSSASIVEDDNFVTETLAGIYAKQGYFKLAVKCYEKLILLYPKKSAYFAALIGDIKKKTNN